MSKLNGCDLALGLVAALALAGAARQRSGNSNTLATRFNGDRNDPRFDLLDATGRPVPGSFIQGHVADADLLRRMIADETWTSNEEHGATPDPIEALALPPGPLGYASWLETSQLGTGHGSTLWRVLRDYLRERGITDMYTTATPHAAPFWRRMGFGDHPWNAGHLIFMHQRVNP